MVRILKSLLVASIVPLALRAQARTDTIRGTVTVSGKPVAAATVIATRSPDRAIFRTETDSAGAFRMLVAEGTGDYLVYASAPGLAPFRKRITAAAGETVFTVEVKFQPAAAPQLAAVTVRAMRPVPARGPDFNPDSPGDRGIDGVAGGTAPDQQGDLASLAATLPGVIRTADGISVLGLPSTSNSVTLNGMAFPGSELPRDVKMNVRVSTTPFDPARGWFSGANIDAQLPAPGLFAFRKAHTTLSGPVAANTTSPRGAAFNYAADGPADLAKRRFYNVAFEGSRQATDAPSLLSASSATLASLGLPADSVARFGSIAGNAGIPTGGLAAAGVRTTGSVFARLDRNDVDMRTGKTVPLAWGITAFGRMSQSSRLGATPILTPSRSIDATDKSGSLNASMSRFFGDRLLEARTTIAGAANDRTPGLLAPAGQVRVHSGQDSTDGEMRDLMFGGNAGGQTAQRRLTSETAVDFKFFRGATHRVKLSADLRYDAGRQRRSSFGTFTFASLDDLEAGLPSSFTRTLGETRADGGVVNAFAAIGDLWTPTSALQVNYGVRLEGARYTTAGVPGSMHASPRVGFTWRIAPGGNSYRTDDLGAFRLKSPRYLRGGVGEFRELSALSPALDAVSGTTGAPILQCVGSATPTPDWSAYANSAASIPTACAGGTSVYASSTPARHVFASDFSPARSWRGNLSYATQAGPLSVTLDGAVSLNLDQASRIDRNRSETPAFVTAVEQRPVYAPVSAIVPSSGLVAPDGARIDGSLGSVMEHRSDLQSLTSQYSVVLSPYLGARHYTLRSAYTLSTTTVEFRGAEGTSFGSSSAVQRARGITPRHQFLTQFGVGVSGLSLTGIARVSSGVAFTPIVGQDVDGDGWVNDRAFVFAPASTSDAVLADGMQRLLASAPASARRCLESQMNTPASQNSCRGSWTAALDATARINRPGLRARRINSIDLSLTNVLAGLDAMFHGAELRGWGQTAVPNPVLYTVNGFDPATRAYTYRANQQFGRPTPGQTRIMTPFRLVLDVSMNLGTPIPRQQFNSWVLPGRNGHSGKRLTFDEVRARYARQLPDPYQLVLAESDSLLLTRAQVDTLKALQVPYRARVDSLWTDLARYVSSLDDSFDSAEAFRRQEATLDRGWEIAWNAVRGMNGILSPVQLRLLPLWAGMLHRAPTPPKGFRAAR